MNHIKKATWQTDTAVLTMASRSVPCRLCRSLVPRTKTVHLFTCAGIQKGWAPRISLLLGIAVEKQDKLSSQICTRCANRVESLEKAVKDLVAFKAMARCSLERVTGFKRAKATSGDVGVSPDTIRDRPGSKDAKRLAFSCEY